MYKIRYQIVCILQVCVQLIFNIQTAVIHVIPAYFVLTKTKIINQYHQSQTIRWSHAITAVNSKICTIKEKKY